MGEFEWENRPLAERLAADGVADWLGGGEAQVEGRVLHRLHLQHADAVAYARRPQRGLADFILRQVEVDTRKRGEAMEERRVTVDGVTRELPVPFVVLATQNPVGSAGTQMLPPSQLDRFLVQLSMGYPDVKNQALLMKERHHEDPLDSCRAVIDTERLSGLSAAAMDTYVADELYTYIAQLAEATRKHPEILLGLSPRGALALARASKANAFLEGRDYATPDDVLAVFADVAAHRLVLSAKARLHELTPQQLLKDIAAQVKKPDVREFRLK